MFALPAQAATAPADPATVLRKLLVPGGGVVFSERSKTWLGEDPADPTTDFRIRGTLAFGKGTVAAGDVTRVTASGKKFRFRVAGGRTYASGGAWSDMLPKGKKWTRASALKYQPYELSEQNVNIFEPAALRRLLGSTKSTAPNQPNNGLTTTRYSGSVTTKALCAVSPACRKKFGRQVDIEIFWQLWTNDKGQVVQLLTKWTWAKDENAVGGGSEVNTHYSGWGSRVTVKAPPANQVAAVS
ncbi:hypothetical protein [Streptosporangium saharense]|uniref:hypothetical protein n=1 Tax=Streptosporangium saharense TaxID=1706840 RepID=UPI003425451B